MNVRLVYNHLPKITAQMEKNVSAVVRTAALRIEAEAKVSMSGPKHGVLYKRGKKSHRASAPGEAPAVDTGKLKNSIKTKTVTPLHAQVIASAAYARILEERRNRKFFGPVVERLQDWFKQAMIAAIRSAK